MCASDKRDARQILVLFHHWAAGIVCTAGLRSAFVYVARMASRSRRAINLSVSQERWVMETHPLAEVKRARRVITSPCSQPLPRPCALRTRRELLPSHGQAL